MQKNEKAITLVALVVTIVILLILAGISIASLTGSGLFSKTQEAKQKTENAQIQENTTLNEYEQWLANYLGGGTTSTPQQPEQPQEPEQPPVTLASKVNVGDYVKYEPDEVETATHTALISEIGTYSGNTDTSYNTSSIITQETSLNWRVLDKVEDENGNECVRLISATPTTSKVQLYGAKGYNNAVYLLDKTCNTFYNKTGYTKNVQSLKIEDIQKYLTFDYTSYTNSYVDTGKYGGTKTYTDASDRYYPNLFKKEKTGWVDGIKGTELDLSVQTSPINEESTQAGTSIKITQTYWYKSMVTTDFTDVKYYNLFINDGTNNYPTYWMSSRCVVAYSNRARFGVRNVFSGYVNAYCLYYSGDYPRGNAYALRPVITLKSDILVDTTDNTKDGTEAGKAYVLK